MFYKLTAIYGTIISLAIAGTAPLQSTRSLSERMLTIVGCSPLDALIELQELPRTFNAQVDFRSRLVLLATFGNRRALTRLDEISRLPKDRFDESIISNAKAIFPTSAQLLTITIRTPVTDPVFNNKTLPWIVLRAALGDDLSKRILKKLAETPSSKVLPAAQASIDHLPALRHILAAKDLTQYAAALNAFMIEEYNSRQSLLINTTPDNQSFARSLIAFIEGPAATAFIIDQYFRALLPYAKNDPEAQASIHDRARNIANTLRMAAHSFKTAGIDPNQLARIQTMFRRILTGYEDELLGVVTRAIEPNKLLLAGQNIEVDESGVVKGYLIGDPLFRLELQNIIQELIHNAGKNCKTDVELFAGQKRTVIISYDSATNSIRISDNGKGMPHPEIWWVPGAQGASASAGILGSGGHGLGKIKKTADDEGISIEVESALGVGTTFLLTLPKDKMNH